MPGRGSASASVLRTPGVSWAVAVAVAIMVAGTIGANRQASIRGPIWLAALLAACALVPAVATLPMAVTMTASSALTAIYFVVGYADGPVLLAVPAASFMAVSLTATDVSGRMSTWWTAAATGIALAGIWARDVLHPGVGQALWPSIGQVALVAAAAALAVAWRARRAAAGERARNLASEERLRMAADLHDGVGHGLALIAMQAGAALHVLDRRPESVRANLEAIREASRESLELLRGQVAQLAGATPAPRTPSRTLADIPALVARVRSGGLDVLVSVDPDLTASLSLPESVERAAYAVVQEGLTNVLRHAGAAHAAVVVERSGDRVVVTVSDDGRGIAAHGTTRAGDGAGVGVGVVGRGIAGMRSRVQALGGTLTAGPGSGGFVVRASIPTEEQR